MPPVRPPALRLNQWPINAPLARGVARLIPVWERWFSDAVVAINGTISGLGDPEGFVTDLQGTLYRRTDGAAGTTLYEKTSGGANWDTATNTGWVPIVSGGGPAAAGTLTGTTLAANVVNSSLVITDGQLSSNVALKNGTNAFTGANSFATNVVDLIVGQLAFPATQNPSTNVNTLDDYKEGNSPGWTPADGSGAGLAFTAITAEYLKVGSGVLATFLLTYPVTASGAGAVVTGLPFTARNVGAIYGGWVNFQNSGVAFRPVVIGNTITIQFFTDAGVAVTNAQFSAKQIGVSVFYRATA
jgi:hypothetical protein